MGVGLVRFIANTLFRRMNDPNNSVLWLPPRLAGLDGPSGGKLLPLQGADIALGQITDSPGKAFRQPITTQWWMFLGDDPALAPTMRSHKPVPDPKDPWPLMSLNDVRIDGLENVSIAPGYEIAEDGGGYTLKLSLQTNAYPGRWPALRLSGGYTISMSLCTASASDRTVPPAVDGWHAALIAGSGEFAATPSGLFLDLTVRLATAGEGGGRQLSVEVQAVAVRGPDGDVPKISIDELTLSQGDEWARDIWLEGARSALESRQGAIGLICSLSEALNRPENRAQLAGEFGALLRGAVDSAIGAADPAALAALPVSAGGAPVDSLLFDRLRLALNNPSSDLFLPGLIGGLDPCGIGGASLPDQSVMGLTLVDFRLAEIKAAGLSNLQAPPAEARLVPGGVEMGALIGALPAGPGVATGPFAITGRFATHFEGDDTPVEGGYRIEAEQPRADIRVLMSGTEAADLVVTLDAFALAVPPETLRVTPMVDSEFADLFRPILDNPGLKIRLIDAANGALAGQLPALGEALTQQARNQLASRLGG
jgi:hypothetical protein